MTETMQAPTPEQERVKERHEDPTATAEQIARIAIKLVERGAKAQKERRGIDAAQQDGLEVHPFQYNKGDDPRGVARGVVMTEKAKLDVKTTVEGGNEINATIKNKSEDAVYKADSILYQPGVVREDATGFPASSRVEVNPNRADDTVMDMNTFESLGTGDGEGLDVTRDVNAVALGEIRQQIKQQEDLNNLGQAQPREEISPVNTAAIRADLQR